MTLARFRLETEDNFRTYPTETGPAALYFHSRRRYNFRRKRAEILAPSRMTRTPARAQHPPPPPTPAGGPANDRGPPHHAHAAGKIRGRKSAAAPARLQGTCAAHAQAANANRAQVPRTRCGPFPICPGSDPGQSQAGNQRGSDQTGAGFGPSCWKLPEAQPAQDAQPVPGTDQRRRPTGCGLRLRQRSGPGPFPISSRDRAQRVRIGHRKHTIHPIHKRRSRYPVPIRTPRPRARKVSRPPYPVPRVPKNAKKIPRSAPAPPAAPRTRPGLYPKPGPHSCQYSPINKTRWRRTE